MTTHISSHQRINILGVNISAINMAQAVEIVTGDIASHESTYVCITPAHSVMECQYDPSLRRIFNASGMTTPDGMAIVWLLKLKGQRHVSRVYGPDLMLTVCEQSVRSGLKHFLYGGAPQVAEKLTHKLQTHFPGLQITGIYCPPFRPLTSEEDQAVIQQINDSQADIVWVGISTPKQERWMAEHVGKVGAPLLIGVGAAFDFLSGAKKQAPRWIQNSGLEWLYRLASEPKRLWRRYIQYPLFALLVLAQAIGIKRYSD